MKKEFENDKEREMALIDELASFDSYFKDTFTDKDIEQMKRNIGDDYPLLYSTSTMDRKGVKELKDMINQLKKTCEEYDQLQIQHNNEVDELIECMIQSAQKFSDQSLFEKVAEKRGMGWLIRYKIEHDMPLWQMDLDYIKIYIK